MQSVTTVRIVPPDLPGIISQYLGDVNNMTDAENRILEALRENYVTHSDLAGNGKPGIYTRLALLETAISTTQRLRFHVATAVISVIIGWAGAWGLSRITAAPIAKETAADQQRIEAVEQKVDQILDRLPVTNNLRAPAPERQTERRPARKSRPRPKGGALLRDGEFITTRAPLLLSRVSVSIPAPEIR